MKPLTEQQIFNKLAAVCAAAEHCQQDMRDRMDRWAVDRATQQSVLERLVLERYIDEERYARCFVHDKLHFNRWGEMKLRQALHAKHIAPHIIDSTLAQIDPQDYIDILRPLLIRKRQEARNLHGYALRNKLLRHALSHGFTPNIKNAIINTIDDDEPEYLDF